MPTTWLAYRLFIHPQDLDQLGAIDDYVALLRQVVHPLLAGHAAVVGRFFFQQYAGPYRLLEEDGGVETPIGAGPEDLVHFIRFHVEVEADHAERFFDRLVVLCHESAGCRGGETPLQHYDPAVNLGDRFGPGRVDAVLQTLHGASSLALQFATDGQPYDPTPNGQGGSAGLMHLLGSTLRYVVPGFLFENGMYHRMPLPCVVLDWERELQYNSYPLP